MPLLVIPVRSVANFLFVVAAIVSITSARNANRVNVSLSRLTDPMAVCIDGSPAGFYHRPAGDAAHETKWMIYMEGGGWCWDVESCYLRSLTPLGSSTSWPQSLSGEALDDDGPQSSNCTTNPTFCNFHYVFIRYCDGTSFSGRLHDDIKYTLANGSTTSLFLRGHYILQAVLDTLLTHSSLSLATEVVLSGCSAGGLATFLHADRVRDWLLLHSPLLVKFGALPLSGFFLDHANALFQPIYRSNIRRIFALSNATHSVSPNCLASVPESEAWRCAFAPYSFAVSTVPTFVQNSFADEWQAVCILDGMTVLNDSAANYVSGNCSAVPGYSCIQWGNGDVFNCSDSVAAAVVQFHDAFLDVVWGIPTFQRAGNVAHINSCYTHCEVHQFYSQIVVQGLSMANAVDMWWARVNGTATTPETNGGVILADCSWSRDPLRQCNPTCPL